MVEGSGMTALAIETSNTLSTAERLHSLFQGAEHLHGTHGGRLRLLEPGAKIDIKLVARTVYEQVTPHLWERHLAGERSLGICPLRSDDTCLFGAIDLDDRQTDHAELVDRVKTAGLPLVVCRSKSGGAHLYAFLSEPIPASDLQRRLAEFSSTLGFPPKTEIFPKQTCNADIDKSGGWLNMPYFDEAATTRYAVKPKGLAATIGEFLHLAEGSTVTPNELMAIRVSSPAKATGRTVAKENAPTEEEFDTLLERWLGKLAEAPNGTRDDTLMKIARDIGRWGGVIEVDYPVVLRRVQEVWQRLGKPEADFHAQYHHNVLRGQKQGDPPRLADGGGGDGSDDRKYPIFESVVRFIGGDETTWHIKLRGHGTVSLNSREMNRYELFTERCIDVFGVKFQPMKAGDWAMRLDAALRTMTTETVKSDETPAYRLMLALREFLMDKHQAQAPEEMVVFGKPWPDTEEDRVWYRHEDLHRQLCRVPGAPFPGMKSNKLGEFMFKVLPDAADYNNNAQMWIGNPKKNTKLRWVRRSLFDKIEVPLPPLDAPPI